METIVLSLFIINHKDFPFYNLCTEQNIKRCLIIGRKSATNAIASSFFTIENLERKTTRSRQDKILHRHAKINANKDCQANF